MTTKFIIQSTITKISSSGTIEIKGCEGYTFKKEGTDMNLLLEWDGNKSAKSDGRFCLREQYENYKLDGKLVDFLRDAACNNKKVELEIENDTVKLAKILA